LEGGGEASDYMGGKKKRRKEKTGSIIAGNLVCGNRGGNWAILDSIGEGGGRKKGEGLATKGDAVKQPTGRKKTLLSLSRRGVQEDVKKDEPATDSGKGPLRNTA